MDPIHPNPPPDPEFGSYSSHLLRDDLGGEPESYLRLVANPFLAFAFLVGWLAALYQTVIAGFAGPLTPMLVVLLLASLALVPWLAHYHCLDCGETGRLMKWRKHACHKSLARRQSGIPRRLRGPSPPLQVLCWLWVTMMTLMMLGAYGPRFD